MTDDPGNSADEPLSPIDPGSSDFASPEEAAAFWAAEIRHHRREDERDLATLRAHLLTLGSHSEWLERARSYAVGAELHERAAEGLIARQGYEEARVHRATAEGLRARQRACEGLAGAVR